MRKYFFTPMLFCISALASDNKQNPFNMFITTRDIKYSIAQSWAEVKPYQNIHSQTLEAQGFQEKGISESWDDLGTYFLQHVGSIILAKEGTSPQALFFTEPYHPNKKEILMYQCAVDTEKISNINDLMREALSCAYPEATVVYFIGLKNDKTRTIFKILNWSQVEALNPLTEKYPNHLLYSLSLQDN